MNHYMSCFAQQSGELHLLQMLSQYIYLADFNLRHSVLLQSPTLKSLRRFKSRSSYSPCHYCRDKGVHTFSQRGRQSYYHGALHTASRGLGMCILWGRCSRREDVNVCVWETSSHSACGQTTKPPVIFVSLSALRPSSLLIWVISTVQHWSLTYAPYRRLNTLHLPLPATATSTARHPLYRCQSSHPPADIASRNTHATAQCNECSLDPLLFLKMWLQTYAQTCKHMHTAVFIS